MAQSNAILPPLSSAIADQSGMIRDSLWLTWFNQVYQILYANLQVALQVPQYSTTAIAQIETSSQPFIVFDSTLGKFKGWDGTQYVVFNTTP